MSPRPLVLVNYTQETFTSTQSGALATYVWEVCRAASALGHEPWVLTRGDVPPTLPWHRLLTVSPPREVPGAVGDILTRGWRKTTGWPRQRQRAWGVRVAKTLRDQGLGDAVLLLQNDPELAVQLRALLPASRIVLLFQNQLPAREPFRGRLRGAVDAVAAVSDFTAAWVQDHYGLAASSVTTVYSGVDSKTFRPAARSGPPVIGFVGRTGIEKAPDLVLRAALRIAEETTAFAVQIVGSNHWDRYEHDAYQQELEELAVRLTATGVVLHRPGHVGRADLPASLVRSGIHVVPSRWDEPFGLTTLEGMATGNAVVASRTGGTPEVVGPAGLLFERDDVDGLAGHLHELVTDPDRRHELAAAARARAEEWTWTRTAQALLRLGDL